MSAVPNREQFLRTFDAIPSLAPVVTPVRQPNELLLAIILKTGPLTPAEAAYVAACEARAA